MRKLLLAAIGLLLLPIGAVDAIPPLPPSGTIPGLVIDNSTASHALYKSEQGTVENQILTIDAHAASTTITLIPGIEMIIHNSGQAASDINNNLPAVAEGTRFLMQVRTAQTGKYWRLTAASAGTVCLDGTCSKNYVQFANPAVGNAVRCEAAGTNWFCYTVAGTATTN